MDFRRCFLDVLVRRVFCRRMEIFFERLDVGDICKYGKKLGVGYDYCSCDIYVGCFKKVNIVFLVIYDVVGVVEDFCIFLRLYMIVILVWIFCS